MLTHFTKKIITASLITIGFSASAQIQLENTYVNKYSDTIGTFQGIKFREGGFSGLHYIPGTNGKEFYTIGDRGVNVDAKNAACTPTYDKIYGFPTYSPKIHHIKIGGDSIQILETMTVKRPNGTGATGVLNPTGWGSTNAEQAWSDTSINCANTSSKTIAKDVWALDAEGIVIGKNNDFWVCEEGGATVWNLDANGKVIHRYSPFATQPGAEAEEIAIDTVFKYRKNNRGFEGIAITPSGKVYAIIQSPILYPDKATGEASLIHRILEINPNDNSYKMYAYLNPGDFTVGADKIKAKDWKIGDLAAINDTSFLVIEAGISGANIQKNIYQIGISNATPVRSGVYGSKTLECLKNAVGLASENIIPVTKKLFMDLRANQFPDSLEKAEGLTIINDSTIAICNDNDFGQMSTTENGVAEATTGKSTLFIYGLKGSNKVQNYVAQSQVITSVKQLSSNQKSDFFIYPNPAKGEVNFNKMVSVEIYNMLGQMVLSASNVKSINIENLNNGLYIVKTSENEVSRLIIE